MRRLVSSDWQLADGARDRYRLDFVVKTLPKLIEKYEPDQLLILGDITEAKDNHPASLVNEIANTLCNIAQSFEIEIIVLQGNHDFLHNAHPFFAFLENFRNIHWISKPEILDNCLYLPHTRDYKKDWANVDLKVDYDFIFAHNIFEGVTANGHALSGIPCSVFPRNAFVISGDVHEPQTLGNGVVTYVGSPCLCDFGDNYDPRVLLLDDLKVKSIKVHGQQKRLVRCSVNRIAGKRELAFDHTANEGDIVKIQVQLIMDDVAEWATIREQVEQRAVENRWIVHAIVPQVAYEQGRRQKISASQRKTDEQYLTSFVQRSGVDERTTQVGKEIINLAE
jgi:DNA repair exonuclease SbcCD nuclease subunit